MSRYTALTLGLIFARPFPHNRAPISS
jgi:hypothetical protein